MSTDNRFLQAVTKLNELTQERQLKWEKESSPENITRGTDDLVNVAYYTRKDGKTLRIYELKYHEDPNGGPWESVPVLEIVDKQGNSEWKFPTTAATWHLLESVKFQTSGVDDFITSLIEDTSNVPFTEGNLITAFSNIRSLKPEGIASKSAECRTLLNKAGVRTKAQLAQLVASTEILGWLEKTYVQELLRDPAVPLDPVAVAVWGGNLFIKGLTEGTQKQIIDEIRRSPEYAAKHNKQV